MATIRTIGANLSYLAGIPSLGVSLAANFESGVAAFSDNVYASFQVVWEGNDVNTGTFEIWLSNFEDPNTFGRYPGTIYTMDPSLKALIWPIHLYGMRYGRVYYRANGVTTGTVKVIATAKKG
jgi:hypothetical protein